MKLTPFARVANLVAEVAIDKMITFADALELVADNLEKVAKLESPDLHLKEETK